MASNPTPMAHAEQLQLMARRVGRLQPNWRDPEAFFLERSEIEQQLRKIAGRVARG